MEDKILITLCTDADHTFECASDIIGKEGEGYTTRLTVTIPTALSGFRAYLDFEKPNGEKIRTPELELDNYNVAFYDVVPYLLTDDGVIKVQAVLISGSGQIWKSSKKKFRISKSINAIEEICLRLFRSTHPRAILSSNPLLLPTTHLLALQTTKSRKKMAI